MKENIKRASRVLDVLFDSVHSLAVRSQLLRQTALASFPRSGNTWLRHMIEEATNKRTGSVYSDQVMPRGRNGIVIKTHLQDSHQYTSAVHLVRNPFDAIESYFRWRKDIAQEPDLTWNEHIKDATEKWKTHTLHWLNAECPTYRVAYEDFKADPEEQLSLLLKWLGLACESQVIERAVRRSSLQKMRRKNPEMGCKFFRRGQVGQGVKQFTAEQRQFVTAELDDLLRMCGYR